MSTSTSTSSSTSTSTSSSSSTSDNFFTDKERAYIYELLAIPQGNTFDFYDYNDKATGVITSVPIHLQVDFTTAVDRIEAIIVQIEINDPAGRATAIEEILTEYGAIRLDAARIRGGGGGGAMGARYSPFEHRNHLRDLLMRNLGVRVLKSAPAQGLLPGEIGRTGRNVYR